MRITSGGNVGIGTTNPGYKLHVGDLSNTSAVYNDIFVTGDRVNNDGYYARLIFGNSSQSGGSTASIRAERKTSNYGTELTFYTNEGGSAGNGSERVRITSGGQLRTYNAVKIGTTAYTDYTYRTLYIGGRPYGDTYSIINMNPYNADYNYGFDVQAYDNGTSGQQFFLINNNRDNSTYFKINGSGVHTKPYQPFFMGALANDQSISATTFTTLNFITTQGFYGVNTNSCWNNSTFGFTAPVTGTYLVTISIYTNTVGQVGLFVNNSRKHSIPAGNYSSGGITWGGSAMIPLTAGEVLTLQGYGSGSGVVYANQYHTWAAIYLLG
jgi:hypothetical protein